MCKELFFYIYIHSPFHVLQAYDTNVTLHYRHVMDVKGTIISESSAAVVLCMHCRPMVLGNNVTQHYRHATYSESTM